MTLTAFKTDLNEILPLRNLFLQENNFQIRYNACHERGWTDSYIIKHDNITIAYGSVKGKENISDRDAVFEFYIIPSFRDIASLAFSALLGSSKVAIIECQSNDLLLTSLLYQHAQNIYSDTILFKEHSITLLTVTEVNFRKRNDDDIVFEHFSEPVGDYVITLNNKVIATGGFLLHYNKPFADLYMEVNKEHRRKGVGSFLIQEIKRECYLAGRVPAARCSIENIPSKATLIKAGLGVAGFMLLGKVK